MSSKRTGRPPVDSERIDVRMSRVLLDGIDAFAADTSLNPDAPSRPETVRRIVRDWLETHGLLDSRPAGE